MGHSNTTHLSGNAHPKSNLKSSLQGLFSGNGKQSNLTAGLFQSKEPRYTQHYDIIVQEESFEEKMARLKRTQLVQLPQQMRAPSGDPAAQYIRKQTSQVRRQQTTPMTGTESRQ